MFVLILQDALDNIIASEEQEGELHGQFWENEKLLQITEADDLHSKIFSKPEFVGTWFKLDSCVEWNGSLVATFLKEQCKFREGQQIVLLVEKSQNGYQLSAYSMDNGIFRKENFTIVSHQDILDRAKKIVDIDKLSAKRVSIVGLGSGGSRVAVELAKCGVGFLRLIDYERLDADNVSRHICGLNDLGRFKTHAVRDRILQHNPFVEVECLEMDVRKSIEQFEKVISYSDLIVAATGSPAVNNLINQISIRKGVPAVYAGVWEKASGGYAMRVIPGETPCYNCIHEFLLTTTPIKEGFIVDYSVVEDPNELKAEPGLSIDVGFVTLLQSKLALSILLREPSGSKDGVSHNLFIWLNKPYGSFKPLTLLKANTKRRDNCSICNPERWAQEFSKRRG